MKKTNINNNESNNLPAWAANNTLINIVTNKDLNKFFKICDDRFNGVNKFIDYGYIVGIICSVDFLPIINKYFNDKKLDLDKIKTYKIYIKLDDNIPHEEIQRIKVLKKDDYSFIIDKIQILNKTVNEKLKPQVLIFH